MPKLYISSSTQESNRGVAPFGTEETEMSQITDVLIPLLQQDKRFTSKRNLPSMTPYQSAADSNESGADIHIAIHSNAGGGVGTEAYAYGPGTNSERLAKCLYNKIAPISPGTDRGIKYNKGLIEVGDTVKATSCLIELAFHDNATDAHWLATGEIPIAQALYKGICDYYGYDYRALVVAPPVEPPVAYRVILDGVQVIALASEQDAIDQVRGAVDEGKALKGIVQSTDGVNVFAWVKPVVVDHDPDMYLTVRCRVSKADQAIKDINKLGFACSKLELA